MLKQLNKIMQQKIQANYNKIINKTEKSYDDAAFMTFIDCLYTVLCTLFGIFAAISLTLFFQREILPALGY